MPSELPPLRSPLDLERLLEFEFVRATENAALQSIHWLGRGEKELADAAACSAIYGVFDILDVCGKVVIARRPTPGQPIKRNQWPSSTRSMGKSVHATGRGPPPSCCSEKTSRKRQGRVRAE